MGGEGASTPMDSLVSAARTLIEDEDYDGPHDGPADADGADGRPADSHQRPKTSGLNAPEPAGRNHKRSGSNYDGSEYGSESDLETAGMPPSLIAKIDAVESLARRGADSSGEASDGVFKRVTDGLKDLGSQSGVEGSTTR